MTSTLLSTILVLSWVNSQKIENLTILDQKKKKMQKKKNYYTSHYSKKNKTLINFRLEQFYALFGKKKRNIFPTLVQAEYNNRL